MATAIEDDEFDEEPVAAPKTGAPGALALDKMTATEEERMRADMTRVQERKLGIIMGAVVMITLTVILGGIGFALFFGPATEFAFTPVTHRDLTTPNETDHDNDTLGVPLPPSDGLLYDYHERSLIDEQSDASSAKLFCGRVECQASVRFLEGQLDQSHDACGKLYDHVCSRWQNRHKNLTSERGGASVDDLLAAGYQDRLVALLLDKGNDFSELRSLFQDCVGGHLATEEDVAGTLDAIMATSNDSSVQAVAEVVARMASLGVSPFFDVAANVTNDTVYVTLLPRRLSDEQSSSRDDVSSTDDEAEYSGSVSSKHEEESAFLDGIRRQLCFEIKHMTSSVKNCVLTRTPNMTSPWSAEWHRTTGHDRLFNTAVATLQPFLALTKEFYTTSEDKAQSLSAIPDNSRLLQACLRLIDSYDSASLSSLGASAFPPTLQREAKEILRELNTSLVEAFPGAPSISFRLGLPPPAKLTKQAPISMYSGHVNENLSTTGDTKLKTLLRVATWKKWTDLRDGGASVALSTTPTFVEDSSTVYVPLLVFNITAPEDPHLKSLRLAKIGPRVLKTVFRNQLRTTLNKSRFARCVSGLQGSRHPVGSGRSVDVDVEDAAAFYVALRAYRRQVGEALPIPGSALNSDSLFLLYYVLNKCQVASTDLDVTRNGPFASRGRRQVESVAAAFPGVLFEQCQKPLGPPSCDVDES